jgi:hypothetical protein
MFLYDFGKILAKLFKAPSIFRCPALLPSFPHTVIEYNLVIIR